MNEKEEKTIFDFLKNLKRFINDFRYGEKKRKLTTTAVILIILLYLAGIITQIFTRGQGVLNTSSFAPKSTFTFNPIKVLSITLTDGKIGLIIVGIFAAFIFYNYLLHKDFVDEELDERGFSTSEKNEQGSARWMTMEEMHATFEHDKPANMNGTIIGALNNEALALIPRPDNNKNILVLGPPGSGKTSCVVVVHALQYIKRAESMILTDPKGELASMLTPILEKEGYEIRYFNMKEPQFSHGWDVMGEVQSDPIFALQLASIIVKNTSDKEGNSDFWEKAGINLITGLLLYQDSLRDGNRDDLYYRNKFDKIKSISDFPDGTFAKLYETIYDPGKLEELITSVLNDDGYEKNGLSRPSLSLFAQAKPDVQTSALYDIGVRLGMMQSKDIGKMLSVPDIDILNPAKKKCAYFTIMNDQDKSLRFLSALFFSCFFKKAVEYADKQPNKRCKVPVNLIIDEFYSAGKIPDFDSKISTCRSRDINMTVILQNIGQLETLYPEKQWNTIEGNCSTKIVMGSNDSVTNNYISELSGITTANVTEIKVQKKTLDIYETHEGYGAAIGKTSRNLLNADEVGRLKQENKMLVHIIGQHIIKMDRFHYSQHPLGCEIDSENLQTVEYYFKRAMSKNEKPNKKNKKIFDLMSSIDDIEPLQIETRSDEETESYPQRHESDNTKVPQATFEMDEDLDFDMMEQDLFGSDEMNEPLKPDDHKNEPNELDNEAFADVLKNAALSGEDL